MPGRSEAGRRSRNLPGYQTFGEEGGDEVALAVQPALGRIVEHRLGGITKGGGGDGFAAAIDVLVVEPDR